MPELPEVETVINGIKPRILNQVIQDCLLYTQKLRYYVTKDFRNNIINARIKSVQRRAKYILINLDNLKTIIIHLGMSGRIAIMSNNEDSEFKHTHLLIKFSNNLVLKFIDPRRFGSLTLICTAKIDRHRFFNHLGLEPLLATFNGIYLFEKCKGRKACIKSIIMNHCIVVGVGNIYASEALHTSSISPKLRGIEITVKQCHLLSLSIKKTLRKSIKLGGSSINDYAMVNGKLGNYQNSIRVYDREGKNCLKKTCKGKILRIVISQRSSFYCSHCQK